MKHQSLNVVRVACIVIAILVFSLFVIRVLNLAELDDVHPLISCEEWIAQESDVLWVIPLYQNVSIAKNMTWCEEIRALNKTLGMHGVYHAYREFDELRSVAYLEQGMQVFEQCFGFTPKKFKAPQLALSRENAALLRELGLEIHGKWEQVTHKVYHCEDTGRVKNWVIRLF